MLLLNPRHRRGGGGEIVGVSLLPVIARQWCPTQTLDLRPRVNMLSNGWLTNTNARDLFVCIVYNVFNADT